jgi:hypothetical protein
MAVGIHIDHVGVDEIFRWIDRVVVVIKYSKK